MRNVGRAFSAILFIGGCLALSAPAAADPADGSIGIKLLEAPKNRQDDPRTRQYIVDHLAPGTVIQRKVAVANDSATRRHIDVYAGAATIDGDTFDVSAGAGQNELTSWISIDRPGADVAARSEQQFTVTIAVPPAMSLPVVIGGGLALALAGLAAALLVRRNSAARRARFPRG
jgi:hypothetical protein